MRSFATTPLYALTLLAVVIAAPTHNSPLPLGPHIIMPGKAGAISSRAPNLVPQDQSSHPQGTTQASQDDPLADFDNWKQLDDTTKQSYDALGFTPNPKGLSSKRALPASPIRGVADITLSLGPAANTIGINNGAPAKGQAGQFNGIGVANAQQQQQIGAQQQQQQANPQQQQINGQQQQANGQDFNGPGSNVQGANFITDDGGNNGEALTNHGNGDGEVIVANNGVGANNAQGTNGQRTNAQRIAAVNDNGLGNNNGQQRNALQGGGFRNRNRPVDRKRSTRRRDATVLQKKPGYYRKRDHTYDDKHDGHYEDDDEDCDDEEYSPDFKTWTTSGKPSDRSRPEKPSYQSHPDVDDEDCDEEEDEGKFKAKSPRPERPSYQSHPDHAHDDEFKPRPDHDHEDKFQPADHDHDDHKPSSKPRPDHDDHKPSFKTRPEKPSYQSRPSPEDEDCEDEDENKPKVKLSGPMEATYQPRPDHGDDDKSKSLRKHSEWPGDDHGDKGSRMPEIHGKPDGKLEFHGKDAKDAVDEDCDE